MKIYYYFFRLNIIIIESTCGPSEVAACKEINQVSETGVLAELYESILACVKSELGNAINLFEAPHEVGGLVVNIQELGSVCLDG